VSSRQKAGHQRAGHRGRGGRAAGGWSAKVAILAREFRSKQGISPGRVQEAMDQRIRTPLEAGEGLVE
jgi:hypothetical protein